MSIPYDTRFVPPAPVLHIRLASPGDAPQGEFLTGIADTGSDGTLIPVRLLESVEAIGVGEAILYGVLGETRDVHLYEVDFHIEDATLPNVLVVGDEHGDEIVIGRNILNGLILLLDGQRNLADLLERRPSLGKR
jgi:predicted aspartyl protease